MRTRSILFPWLFFLLAAVTFACSLGFNLSQSGEKLQETAKALVSQQGPVLLSTAQALITREGPKALATAHTYIQTQGPQALATIQTFATEEGPSLLETGKALATENAPGLLATAQALATQAPSGLVGTLQSNLTTVVGTASANSLQDVPLYPPPRQNFETLPGSVSYSTPDNFQNVLQFYLNEMPKNGWSVNARGTLVTASTALLLYSKDNRTITVALSVDPTAQTTSVQIIAINLP